MVEFKKLPLAKLAMNTGQIEGLPANPRQWTQEELDKLAKSIEETPELLDARGAIVVPHKGKFVVLGGNMRVTAARKLNLKEMPCAVLPEDTAVKKLREIVVKDNGSFGAWDFDALANEWDDEPLTDWGVPAWDTERDEEITDDVYTKKIEIPSYTPNTELGKPNISELFDKSKYEALCEKIKGAALPPDVEFFLLLAATRHIVFNYERIGDYYAEADKKVQRLMEDSALVIIDWKGAIDKGFVKLTKTLDKIYANGDEGE